MQPIQAVLSLPLSNAAAVIACMASALAAFAVFRFTRAYADLTLLSKRHVPASAFQGKTVWIVGASQGLGEALALYFAAAGAKLILSSRSLEKLQAVKDACTLHTSEDDVHLVPMDLTGPTAEIDAAVNTSFSNYGEVDYIIHNAGASQHAAAEDTSQDVAAALIDLNLIGPIRLARATLPHMLRRQHGTCRHVVVASMSAVVPSPGQAVYAAAKSGLRAYFASIAAELAGRGVEVTIVCPGPLATGGGTKPRVVYGSEGLIQQTNTGMSTKRIPAALAAELIAAAAYHGLAEAWIAYHPVLLLGYLCQYMPSLGRAILRKIGPGRVRQLRDGSGSGYDVSAMLQKS